MDMEGPRRTYSYSAVPSKDWKSLFSEQQHGKASSEKPWVQTKRKYNGVGDEWEFFWRNDDQGGSMGHLLRLLQAYCRDVPLSDLKSANQACPPIDKSAWIDGYGTVQSTALSAPQLYKLLKPSDESNKQPNCRRRFIFISGLSPMYILALTENATFHQVPALKIAIEKHLKFKAAIGVHVSTRGKLTFRLDAHIPYMMLRPRSAENANHKAASKAVKNTPKRDILDLSVFGLDYELEKAHFSLSISGFNDLTWVAYAFADDTLDEDNEDNDDSEDDEDDGKNEDEQPDANTFIMDKMAPGGEVDAKMHREDPREFFLTVYDVRIREATEKWCDVVDTLEDHLEANHPSTLIQFSNATAHRNGNSEDRYLRARDAMNRLRGIQRILNNIVTCWETFASSGGQIDFFRTPGSYRNSQSEEHVYRLLASITNTFVVLKERQQVLLAVQESCQAIQKDLELDLTLQSNRTANRAGLTAQFTLFISPLSLVTAYFSIPGAAKVTPPRFIIATLIICIVFWLGFYISLWLWCRQQRGQTIEQSTGPRQLRSTTNDRRWFPPWKRVNSFRVPSSGGSEIENSWRENLPQVPKKAWTVYTGKGDAVL